MAIFEISQNRHDLNMTVSVDKEDFLQTLLNEFPDEYSSLKLPELALEYLKSKVYINVNGECASFEIEEVKYGDLNILIKGSLNLSVEHVKEVTIRNTCMIDLFEGHDNIIKLKLNDLNRSFRLNQDRVSTVAKYE